MVNGFMKTLLIAILLLALFAGSLLAFSGSSASARDDGNVRAADADRTSATANKTADDTDTHTDRTASAIDTRDESDRMSGRNTTVKTIEDEDRTKMRNRTAVMSSRTSWNATEAALRCSDEETDEKNERCMMKMANASLYSKAELREVNESWLHCANESTLSARTACRLELPENEQKDGLYYLPEECRNLSGEERGACLARYDAIQPCRFETGDDERFKCVRERIGLNASAKELVDECKRQVRGNTSASAAGNGSANDEGNAGAGINNSMNGGSNDNERGIGACVSEVRAQVFEESKFRIYNLEEKAERLSSYGVSNATITEFVSKLEEYKAQFVAADGSAAKKDVLKQVEAAWKEFVQKARTEAQMNRKNARTGADDGEGAS